MKAIILLSGGVDSALCLAEMLDYGFECVALTFHYGQRHVNEICAAEKIACHYDVEHKVMVLPVIEGSALTDAKAGMPQGKTQSVNQTYVPGRNLILLSFGCSYAEAIGAGRVVMGACKEDATGYPDCRHSFFAAFRHAVRCGMNSDVLVITPNIDRDKKTIFEVGRALKVPFDMTWSCYDPQGGNPCGTCSPCLLNNEYL